MIDRARTAAVLCLRYLYLTRFSWMLGGLLVLLVPICRDLAPSLLANLLVLDRPEQVFHVSWITFWCGATVMETLRVTTMNAQLRFEDYRYAVEQFRDAWDRRDVGEPDEWFRHRNGWTTFVLGVTAAVIVWWSILHSCIAATAADPSALWAEVATVVTGEDVARIAWQQALLGLTASLSILITIHLIVIVFHESMRRRRERCPLVHRSEPIPRLRRLIHRFLGPGYFREVYDSSYRLIRLRLTPGHVGLLMYTLTFCVWYAFNYMSASGESPMPTESSPYPAFFYALLSFLLMLYLLPGIAFFFDRYRIPISLLFLGSTLVLYSFFGTDHYYELNPSPQRTSAEPIRDWAEVLGDWSLPRDRNGERTMVIVDASGGGIQAAAWTAQVLTGLHEEYGDSFSRSVTLISSVSGGSVGTMYYLLNRAEMQPEFDPLKTVLSPHAIEQIRTTSRASALEATTWGIAYPDTMRVLFPPVVGSTIDRGWAVERVWRQRMQSPDEKGVDLSDVRLTEMSERVHKRQLPSVVFNATITETGQRLLMSPVLSPPAVTDERMTAGAVEMLREFPEAHPRVSTAARLSATFPYVSPAARASRDATQTESSLPWFHVVDGGYSDNEGAVTSVDWINRLIAYYSQDHRILDRPFDRVLLIRIHAFPADEESTPHSSSSIAGWRAALLGPLDAMMQVRRASQTERGDLEIGLLTQATRATMEAASRRYAADYAAIESTVGSDSSGSPNSGGQGMSSADRMRQQLESHDRMRSVEPLKIEARQKQERLAAVGVQAVTIDFHPIEDIRIPLSWKLTESQKRHLDAAWQLVVTNQHPHRPLDQLDRIFLRRSPPEAEPVKTAGDGRQRRTP